MIENKTLYVYKASAGSGKTFTLALEYIKLLITNPKAYKHTLAVTFTNKATGEMKERILSTLYGVANRLPSSEDYFEKLRDAFPEMSDETIQSRATEAMNMLLHDYGHFRIQTIDAFFQSVLRGLAKELELSGDLDIIIENSNELLSKTVDLLIKRLTPTSQEMGWLVEFVEENLDNNLTAVIAFYVYTIIGMDFDSMGELGGSEFLNKALTIANNAQNLGDAGWRAGSNNNNRYSIIDDYMNGALEPVRKLMYKYHRLGLDTMFKDADGGRKAITESISLLKKAYEDRPMAYFTKLFTEYKVDEIVNVYSKCTADEKRDVVKILSEINPSLSSEWDKITKNNN